jgi:hypothetical protein
MPSRKKKEMTLIFRPLSAPHDLIQLMGRGGRGPNVFKSSLEIIWNMSDISNNVPGFYQENIWTFYKFCPSLQV